MKNQNDQEAPKEFKLQSDGIGWWRVTEFPNGFTPKHETINVVEASALEDAERKIHGLSQNIGDWSECIRLLRIERDELKLIMEKLIRDLREGQECPRELCALMAEGEGDSVWVYQKMAKAAMDKIDKLTKEARE